MHADQAHEELIYATCLDSLLARLRISQVAFQKTEEIARNDPSIVEEMLAAQFSETSEP